MSSRNGRNPIQSYSKNTKKSIMNWQITQEQYLVNSLQGCRVLAYPQITEDFFETLLLITVIVRVEHTEKQAFSKMTGTDEEEIARLLLQLWQKHRLIDIIQILTHHRGEIRYSVWYLFYLLFHHAMKFNQFAYAKLRLYFETTKVFTAFLVAQVNPMFIMWNYGHRNLLVRPYGIQRYLCAPQGLFACWIDNKLIYKSYYLYVEFQA